MPETHDAYLRICLDAGSCSLLAAVVLAVTLLASPARAHFVLEAPACFSQQDALGLPEKSYPCGQDDTGNPAVPTDAVTAYMEGGTVTVTISEEITHPGHYRVALAPDMASLPPDPPVTAGATPCGSTVVESNPALPILADGLFEHTTAFRGPQTAEIPLPPGFTCDHCVLQVVEFMSDHDLNPQGGCFYHHCAIVTVASALDAGGAAHGGTSFDAGTPDAGTTTSKAGCGCRVVSGSRAGSSAAAGVLFLFGLLLGRRRRRPRGRR